MIAYLVDLRAFDPATGSLLTLRYGTVGYVTEPTDTPPNATYLERVEQPAMLARNMFTDSRSTFGRATLGYGEIVLKNTEGDLDALRAYGFAGRRCVIRRGDERDAFADFTTILIGTIEGQPHVNRDTVRVKIRDRTLDLDIPVQARKYLGDNVLPDGLEGTAELTGKPKPRVYGVVKNIEPRLVNSAKLIYQVSDRPITSVDQVMDRGILLGVSPTGWATVNHGLGNFAGRSLAKSATALIVGGYDGTSTPKLFRSTDGTTFSDVTSLFANQSVEGLAYGAGVFVAVGFYRSGSGDGTIATSADDGQTWTASSLPASWVAGADVFMLSVRWHSRVSLFLITTSDGRIATSPDGITWTAQTSGVAVALYNSAGDDDVSLLVGASGTVLQSTDLVTWSDASGELNASDVWYAVGTNEDGRWIIVGTDGGTTSKSYRSDSLPAWTAITSPPLSVAGGPFEVIYENGFWVSAGTRFGYSRDGGDDWTAEDFTSAGFGSAFDIILFNSRFYATGETNSAGLSATPAPVTYADEADLLNDDLAPAPGHFGYWLNGGFFRLGAAPDGLITADVTAGKSATDRTAAAIFRRLLWDPMGSPMVPWIESDLEALAAANDDVLGLFIGEEMGVAAAVDLIAQSVGAWWGPDRLGRFRIQQFTAPSGSAVLTLKENQVVGLERLQPNDAGRGVPPWRSIVRYGRFYSVQTADVAGGVTDARRGELAREWREAVADDATVRTTHPLAPQVIEDSQLTVLADAQAEATRRQTLRGTHRDLFQFRCELNDDTDALDLGDVITLEHSRFGLSAGALVKVIGIVPDVRAERLQLTCYK